MRREQTTNERKGRNQEMLKNILERLKREKRKKDNQKINRYNNNYKTIITEKFPKYLEGRKKGKDRSIIAKYRCGNETKGSQYWRENDDQKCRI